MEFNKKKAQGLPLNTIVIALLVVVVLVVIVLAFTTNIGNFNDSLNDNSGSACSAGNPAIQAFVENASDYNNYDFVEDSCSGVTISAIRNSSGAVCCATN